jgi:peptidoglycan/xylan/chitin deacetylase (PgdA/CDA1 family)
MSSLDSYNWPNGSEVAVSLTFDVDADTGRLAKGDEYERRLSTLSEARYSVMRGLPRILDLLREFALPATFFVPGHTAALYPHAVEAILADGHEVGHHSHMHLRSDHISARRQREEIEQGFRALAEVGVHPKGYRSPAGEVTPETFALLVEHGFAYDSSFMADDRPYIERFGDLEILELPWHWSLDDWPYFGYSNDFGGNVADPRAVAESWYAEYQNARAEQRHMVLTMHPEIIGRAYRLASLRTLIERMTADGGVWFAGLGTVAEHVRPLFGPAR